MTQLYSEGEVIVCLHFRGLIHSDSGGEVRLNYLKKNVRNRENNRKQLFLGVTFFTRKAAFIFSYFSPAVYVDFYDTFCCLANQQCPICFPSLACNIVLFQKKSTHLDAGIAKISPPPPLPPGFPRPLNTPAPQREFPLFLGEFFGTVV